MDLGALIAGSTLSWTSPCLEYLEEDPDAPFRLTVEGTSWIGALLGVGALLSAIPTAWAADKLGRRGASFACICAPSLASWPLALLAQSSWQLYLARLLAGAGVGGVCTLAPMYIGELSGDKARSWLGSLFPLGFCSGIFLTFILVAGGIPYRPLTMLLGCLPVLNVIAIWTLAPESPSWLVRNGRLDDAARSLHLLGRPVKINLTKLEDEVACAPPSVSLAEMVRRPGYRMRLIACIILFVFQQFSGINAVMFYTVAIFKAADSGMDPVQSSCLVAAIQVVAVVMVAVLIDRAGRRTYLLGSAAIAVVCHLALGLYFHVKATGNSAPGWVPLVSLLLFVFSFAIGFGSVPWVQIHELSPGESAATLSAVAMVANWSTGTLVTKTFGPAAHAWGEHTVFYTYAGLNLLGVLLVAICVPETRGKQQHEIFPQYKI